VSVYLDASILVALFTSDALTARADSFLRRNPSVLIVSDFAAAEFSSVIARHVRTKDISKDEARLVFSNFDTWTARTTQRAPIGTADVIAAEVLLRRFELALRTPDALNIAMAQRLGAMLATFDSKMAAAARTIGTEIAKA
jgi:predicted nucleic acid-binding protein